MVEWTRSEEAFEELYNQLVAILAKLDAISDPQLAELALKTIIQQKSKLVMNRGQVANGDFEEGTSASMARDVIPGWNNVGGGQRLSSTSPFSGFYRCEFKYTTMLNGIYQVIAPPIPVDGIDVFTFMAINEDVSDRTMRLTLYYSDGTIDYDDFTCTAWAGWVLKTPTPTATKYIIGMKFEVLSGAADYTVAIDSVTLKYKDTIIESNSAAIKTAVELIDNMISGSEGQVDVVAALPAGTNLLGKIDINSITRIGSPTRIDRTTAGQLVAAPGSGYKLQFTGCILSTDADETVQLRWNGATGDIFLALPTKGILGALPLVELHEGGDNQNMYATKSGSGNLRGLVFTKTVAV